MRKFEKISYEQFKKDVCDDIQLYEEYSLPKRETKYAAGYDFYALFDFTLKPSEIIKLPTGVKVDMNDDEVLFIVDRSGMGFKYNIRMCNQIGVIDKDYYNNKDNEGHLFIKLQNEGDKDWIVRQGEGIGQGIFMKYLTCDDEDNDFNERESDY